MVVAVYFYTHFQLSSKDFIVIFSIYICIDYYVFLDTLHVYKVFYIWMVSNMKTARQAGGFNCFEDNINRHFAISDVSKIMLNEVNIGMQQKHDWSQMA